MKLIKISNLITLGLALTFAAAGCKTKPTPLTMLPGERTRIGTQTPLDSQPRFTTPAGASDNPINLGTPGGGNQTAGMHPGWPEDATTLKPQTIYFEYDKSAIKAAEHSKLEEVANYLRSHPRAAVRVEGNCDERGTEEYNRALGERRALAARAELVAMGIAPDRVDTVSYGEDKPAETGHDSAAWAKNRRDDFVVLNHP